MFELLFGVGALLTAFPDIQFSCSRPLPLDTPFPCKCRLQRLPLANMPDILEVTVWHRTNSSALAMITKMRSEIARLVCPKGRRPMKVEWSIPKWLRRGPDQETASLWGCVAAPIAMMDAAARRCITRAHRGGGPLLGGYYMEMPHCSDAGLVPWYRRPDGSIHLLDGDATEEVVDAQGPTAAAAAQEQAAASSAVQERAAAAAAAATATIPAGIAASRKEPDLTARRLLPAFAALAAQKGRAEGEHPDATPTTRSRGGGPSAPAVDATGPAAAVPAVLAPVPVAALPAVAAAAVDAANVAAPAVVAAAAALAGPVAVDAAPLVIARVRGCACEFACTPLVFVMAPAVVPAVLAAAPVSAAAAATVPAASAPAVATVAPSSPLALVTTSTESGFTTTIPGGRKCAQADGTVAASPARKRQRGL